MALHCLLFFLSSLLAHLSSSFPVAGPRDSVSTKSSSSQGTFSLSLNYVDDIQSAQHSFSDSDIPDLSSTSRSPTGDQVPFIFPFPITQLLGFTGFEPEHFFEFCEEQCSELTGNKCIRRKVPLKKIQTCKKSASFGFMHAPTCCFWSSCYNLVGVTGMKKIEKRESLWLKEAMERACKGKKPAKPKA